MGRASPVAHPITSSRNISITMECSGGRAVPGPLASEHSFCNTGVLGHQDQCSCPSVIIPTFVLGSRSSTRARQSDRCTRNQIKDKTIHLNTSTSVILSQIRSWCLNEKVVSCRGKAWLWPLSRQLTNLFIHNFYLLVQVRLR